MTFSAVIPLADMDAANTTLEAAGYGPRNFSIPVYTDNAAPTHGTMHYWIEDDAFATDVKALPNVQWSTTGATPTEVVQNTISVVGGSWGNDALPLEGLVTPGLHYTIDDQTAEIVQYWWVIQQYDTAEWPDPEVVPALVRRARVPGVVEPWVQPIDQFDAYKLVNAFTGEPDRATHLGDTWEVDEADGAGNNTSEPGVFGWKNLTTPVAPWEQGVYDEGEEVTHDNPQDGGNIWLYRSKIDANTTEPGRDGEFDRYWEPIEAV